MKSKSYADSYDNHVFLMLGDIDCSIDDRSLINIIDGYNSKRHYFEDNSYFVPFGKKIYYNENSRYD